MFVQEVVHDGYLLVYRYLSLGLTLSKVRGKRKTRRTLGLGVGNYNRLLCC